MKILGEVEFRGVGIWGNGLCSYADLCERVAGVPASDKTFVKPKPLAIEARERRRAGLMINLAVEVAHQACAHAGLDPSSLPSVFVSAMGDTEITDYMCRKLAQPEKLLSPTKFHNSVHNAPSGYWSISADNHAPSTFVGGYMHSFGAGLLEAVSQSVTAQAPVLLVAYDIADTVPFHAVTPIDESFACALVVAPGGSGSSDAKTDSGLNVSAQVALSTEGDQASSVISPLLSEHVEANPAARGLVLLDHAVCVQQGKLANAAVHIPCASHLSLHVQLAANGPCR